MSNGVTLAADVLARLNALPKITVYDNQPVVTAPDKPFVVFWDGPDRLYSNRHDGSAQKYRWGFYIVCAGRDQESARWCTNYVRSALRGVRIGESMLVEVDNGATDLVDTTIPSDVRFSRTLEFRLHANLSPDV